VSGGAGRVIIRTDDVALDRNENFRISGVNAELRPDTRAPREYEGGEKSSLMTQDLVDRIYECAFSPEHWPGVFDDLAEIAGARGGYLFTANRDIVNWTASEALRPGMALVLAGGYLNRSSRVRLAIEARHAGFLTEHDVYTEETLAADPLYRDLLWPAGLGWCAATAIPSPTGDILFLNFEREKARGPFEAAVIESLDALRPHLARSALMSARLQLERAHTAAETLALIGMPAVVFDEQGKVLAANGLIEALTETLRWRAHDRILLSDPRADRLFHQAIETIAIEAAAPRSFAIRAADSSAALVAHVIPLRRTARDLIVRCAGVLMISPVTLPQAPPVELVQSLFDLTAAEARVARQLTTGQTVDEIATSSGVSLNTVRTQVRGILEKTGSRRQTDAVALLGGIAVQRG
jgi:DNA-binding CsgD family transcriptional regulator